MSLEVHKPGDVHDLREDDRIRLAAAAAERRRCSRNHRGLRPRTVGIGVAADTGAHIGNPQYKLLPHRIQIKTEYLPATLRYDTTFKHNENNQFQQSANSYYDKS